VTGKTKIIDVGETYGEKENDTRQSAIVKVIKHRRKETQCVQKSFIRDALTVDVLHTTCTQSCILLYIYYIVPAAARANRHDLLAWQQLRFIKELTIEAVPSTDRSHADAASLTAFCNVVIAL
jgi:hypothetical protein